MIKTVSVIFEIIILNLSACRLLPAAGRFVICLLIFGALFTTPLPDIP